MGWLIAAALLLGVWCPLGCWGRSARTLGADARDFARGVVDGESPGGVPGPAEGQRGRAHETDAAPDAVGPNTAPEPDAGAELRATARGVLRPIVWLSGVAAAVSLVLSFVTPIVPRRAAGAAAAAFGGALALQYGVTRYGVLFAEIAVWLGVALAALSVAPFVIGFVHSRIRAAGVSLAIEGDARAGVALMAQADRRVNRKRKAIAGQLESVRDAVPADAQGIERASAELRRIDDTVDVLEVAGVRVGGAARV
jgi:hypothetical protein